MSNINIHADSSDDVKKDVISQIQGRPNSIESGYSSQNSDVLSKASSSIKSNNSQSIQEEDTHPNANDTYLTVIVHKYGGHYILSPIDVSLIVPFEATSNRETIIKVKQSTNETITCTYELLSDIFEFQPHAEAFKENITVKLPLKQVPNTNRDVRLLYSNSNAFDVKQDWLVLPGCENNLLENFSWCIIDEYCFISLDHFCYVAVGETQEDDSSDEEGDSFVQENGELDDPNAESEGPGNSNLVQESVGYVNTDQTTFSGNVTQESDIAVLLKENNHSLQSEILHIPKPSSSNTSNSNENDGNYPVYQNVAFEAHELDDTGSQIELNGITRQPSSNDRRSGQVYALLYIKQFWQNGKKLDLHIQLSNDQDGPTSSYIDMKGDHLADCTAIPMGETSLDIRLGVDSKNFKLKSGQPSQEYMYISNTADLPSCTFCLEQCGIRTHNGGHFTVNIYKRVNVEEEIFCYCFKRLKVPWLLTKLQYELTETDMERYQDLKEDSKNLYNPESQLQSQSTPTVTPATTVAQQWNPTVINFNGPTTVKYVDIGTIKVEGSCFEVDTNDPNEFTSLIKKPLSQDFCEVVQLYLKQKLRCLSKDTFSKILIKMGMYHRWNMTVELFVCAVLMNGDVQKFKKLYLVLKNEGIVEIAEIIKHEIEKENIRTNMFAIIPAVMIEELYSGLVTENIISYSQKQVLQNKHTDREKATYLLSDIILKVDRHKFNKFVKILNDNEHLHVSERFCIE